MNKKYSIKLLSVVMSLAILCGLFSPLTVSATSGNAYTNGLQKFFDEGNHAQMVECPDAVYMEYAEQLRTNPVGSISMAVLGLIYGGFDALEKVEPNKDRYKEALLNIIRTYDEENAEIIGQQNLQNDTKEFKDYLHDVVDTEMDWLEAIGASDAMGPAASVALSVINEMAKDEEDLIKGISTLKTTLQNYEKHNTFLKLVAAQAEGELQLAATELSVGLSEVMKVRLLSYADLVKDSSADYAKMFVCEMFAEDFFNALEEVIDKHIGKITYFQAFQAVKLGVDIGKIAGNILIGAEDVMSYVVEIKAVHDISIILENELDSMKNSFQKDNTKTTETDAQNYITYGNYLISSRVHGQYCMTAIYLQPPMQKWLKDSDVENAKALYNRLTTNLFDTKKNLDAICSGVSLTPILSNVEADSIRYYACTAPVDFFVFEKDGKFGLINEDGAIILPAEYEAINLYETSPSGEEHKLYAYDANYQGYWIEQDGSLTPGFMGGWGFEDSAEIYWYGDPVMFVSSEGKVPYSYEIYASYSHGTSVLGTITRGTPDVIPVQEINGYSQTTISGMTTYSVEKVSEKYALLNLKSKKLLTDFIFDDYGSSGFVDGILAVSQNGKWGYINENGKMITDFAYDASNVTEWGNTQMYAAMNGYIIVRQGNLVGLIDTNGNNVIEVKYSAVSQVSHKNLFWLCENGTWSLWKIEA